MRIFGISVRRYNRLVDRYNDLLDDKDTLIAEYNGLVEKYNGLLNLSKGYASTLCEIGSLPVESFPNAKQQLREAGYHRDYVGDKQPMPGQSDL